MASDTNNITINTRADFLHASRIVIKIGTNVLMGSKGTISTIPDKELLLSLSKQVIHLKNNGKEIILVSSGAIGFGAAEMNIQLPVMDIPTRQACASIGQPILMQTYKHVFQEQNSHCAQLLLTKNDFASQSSYTAFSTCINTLLHYGVIPIINENDSVSIDEIDTAFGDNDTLSAIVANKVNAHLLILLTDVHALYDKNPNKYNDAVRIPAIHDSSAYLSSYEKQHHDTGSMLGTGGMHTKLQAAQIAQQTQCPTIIAGAKAYNVLYDILEGKDIGTAFLRAY